MLHKTVSILHNVLYVIAIGAVCAEVAVMGAYEYHTYFGNVQLRTPIAHEEISRPLSTETEPIPTAPDLEEPETDQGLFNSAVIFAVSSEYQSEVYPEI